MLPYSKLSKIPYGGDYNPEQWPEETWEKDMELLKRAHIDTVTLNVFSWAAIQPSEEVYDFDRLDRIVDLVTKNGLKICMATSTAAHPAWMAHRHPDILRTDENGIKRKFGGRHNSCPNSPTYRKYAPALAAKLAHHYKDNANIIAWHVSNEYGGECCCENCEAAFRGWLKEKYGTLDEVNRVWNTAFWGHTFYDWEEIVLPDMRSEHFHDWSDGSPRTAFQGISLDYRRFMSDSILECYRLEYDAIRREIPDAAITTNLMGFFKELDYGKWAKSMDFVSWDSYPAIDEPYAVTAMKHDLMRGVGGQEPFCLMEQTPSVQNWQDYCSLKRPGVMRLISCQAIAHGSDTVMFFQMKRSIGACEKYHGAVIDHVGDGNTRVFREIAELGEELELIGTQIFGKKTRSDIAMMMDWDNWWAIEYSSGPSKSLSYIPELERWYIPLREMNFNIDIISPGDDLTPYKLVIAPVLYMVREGEDENIRRYVEGGGRFITTFFSGYVDEHDLVVTGGYPGRLRDVLGIWVEELDALAPGKSNRFSYRGREYPATLICDILHAERARQVDEIGYEDDFYEGSPVITENRLGSGLAYYVGTASSPEFYKTFLSVICADLGIAPVMEAPEGVEVTSRQDEDAIIYFIMNHSDETRVVRPPQGCADIIDGLLVREDLEIKPKDVVILVRKFSG